MTGMRVIVPVLAVGLALALTGCVPESVRASQSATPSVSESATTAAATPLPTTTSTPTASPTAVANGLPACWTVAVPDVDVTSSQTPEEFAEENPGLIESGAPATCSLFTDGSQQAAADAWIETFIADGWADGGVVADEVYVSRSADGPDGVSVSYLVSVDGGSAGSVSQFQLYQR